MSGVRVPSRLPEETGYGICGSPLALGACHTGSTPVTLTADNKNTSTWCLLVTIERLAKFFMKLSVAQSGSAFGSGKVKNDGK